MSQITINIGSLPNDGKGDPIRTAFDAVNKNFANVFGTGLVGSNLLIQNNSIISTNVNGEIRLVPNGVGNVISNAHILPNATNIRNLGSTNRRWRSVYTQYVDTQNQNIWGNLVVAGNLNVTGNMVTANVSTLDVANLTITLAAGATSPGVADGAGILVDGANANITYSAASNTFDFNIGLGVDGTVDALYFIGDGGGLSNLNVAVNSSSLTGNTISSNIVYSSLTTVGTLANLLVAGNVQTSGVFIGNGAGLTNVTANNITGTVANAYYANLAQNAFNANNAVQAVFATTANHALTAGHADYANRANIAANAVYANTAQMACTADIANLATLASNAIYSNASFTAVTVTANAQPNITSVGTLSNLTVTGNIVTTAGIYTDNYFYANGAPFSGSGNGGGGNYGNSNVAAFLPTYSGNLGAISVTGISSNNYLWANGQPFTGNYGNAQVIALMASGNVPFIQSANVLATSLTVTGYSSLTRLGVTGNANIIGNTTTGNIFSNGYYYANGAPLVVTTQGAVIGDQQIVPDGVSTTFALSNVATTNSIMVSVNGLTQAPGSSYVVTGTDIVFTSVPATSDYIDIRFLGIANSSGGNGGNYGNSNVVSLLSSASIGNTIPAGNAIYSLGNSTNQWKSLYVSGNTIYLNNIPLSVTATANKLNWNGDNVVVSSGNSGNIVTAGNISGNYYFGNGRFLTGIPPQYTDANVATYLASGTDTANIITVGNVRGNYILGNGAFLTGTYANSNVTAYLPTYTGAMTALLGNITTQANITGQYILGNARFMTGIPTAYGNSNVSNYLASGTDTANIITTGNVSGNFFIGNGSQLTGMYGNSGVAAYLASGADTSPIVTQGNVTGQFILGNARFMTGLPVSYGNANVQAFLPTYDGNLVSLSGNVETPANVNAGYFNGNGRFLTGVVSSYGNSNVSTYLASGTDAANIITTANISASYYAGNGRFLTGMNNYSNANVQAYLPTYTGNLNPDVVVANSVTSNVVTANTATIGNIAISGNTLTSTSGLVLNNDVVVTGNLEIMGNSTIIDSNVVTINDKVFVIANNSSTGSAANGSGIQVSNVNFASMLYSFTANAWVFSLPIAAEGNLLSNITGANITGTVANANYSLTANNAIFSGTVTANAQPNITSVGTLANLTVAGNTTSGNVISLGNISGSYFIGNGSQLANITAANIDGTVANANYSLTANNAIFSGTVTTNAQPNITSVGTLVNVNATGNIVTTANVNADFFNGNGRFLSGMYGNADVAAYLPTYTGNIQAGNIDVIDNVTVNNTLVVLDAVISNVYGGNVISDNFYYANGTPIAFGGGFLADQQFTGNGTTTYPLNLVTSATTILVTVNGLTQTPGVAYVTAGNVITFSSALGTSDSVDIRFISNASVSGSTVYNDANVAAYLPSYPGALTSLAGNVTTTANISGNYILGNGAFLTGIAAAYSNANAISLLANLTSNVTTTANISGAYIIGNGSQLSNITGANVIGTVANANYSLFSNSAVFSGTVTTNAQPNITSVGNLANLTVAGITTTTGNITTTGNVSANYYIGNGSLLTGVISSYGNSNVANYMPTYTGNLVSLTGNITTTGNVSANYYIGNGSLLTGITSSYGNANVAAYLPTYSGNLGGTLTSAAQTNITTLGQLLNLTVVGQTLSNTLVTTGNANVGTNVNTVNVRATGNVTAQNLTSKWSGQVATGVTVTLNNLRALVPAAGNQSIQVSTVNGTTYNLVGSEQAVVGGTGATSAISATPTGTAVYLNSARTLTTAGDLQVCNVIDTASGVGYRITLVIGAAALNQITIEQLY